MIIGDPSRDDVEEVMSRREFQYPKSLMERIGDWIADQLGNAADQVPGEAVASGSFSGGVGSLIGWLMVIAALGAVAVVVVIVVRRWVPRVEDEQEPLSDVETEHRRRASEWGREAADLEAAGEWKLAIRARFRELVRTLVDRSQVTDLAGLTTRELLADLAVTTPSVADPFDSACLLFELPWYAHVATGAEENRRFRELARVVLAGAVSGRLDQNAIEQVGRVEVLVDELP